MDDSVADLDYRYRSRRKVSLSKIRRGALLVFAITAAIVFVGAYFAALTQQ